MSRTFIDFNTDTYKKYSDNTPLCRKRIAGMDVCALTPLQIERLKKHAQKHSKKHVRLMIGRMRLGDTFTEAHKYAMKNEKTESSIGNSSTRGFTGGSSTGGTQNFSY